MKVKPVVKFATAGTLSAVYAASIVHATQHPSPKVGQSGSQKPAPEGLPEVVKALFVQRDQRRMMVVGAVMVGATWLIALL